jgi:signal transduction histidine kinase
MACTGAGRGKPAPGTLLSGVAHELNNPLTAILAFAQDLLSQSRSTADTEALTTIVQQSQRYAFHLRLNDRARAVDQRRQRSGIGHGQRARSRLWTELLRRLCPPRDAGAPGSAPIHFGR